MLALGHCDGLGGLAPMTQLIQSLFFDSSVGFACCSMSAILVVLYQTRPGYSNSLGGSGSNKVQELC